MSKGSKHIKMMDRLQQWLAGTTTLKEERQLGQLAQDDPFLADAMDGYHSIPEDNHNQRILEIRKKLSQRTQSKKNRIIPIWVRSVAAAIIGLAMFSVIWFWNSSSTESNDIALIEEAQMEELVAEENMALDVQESDIISESIQEGQPNMALEQDKPATTLKRLREKAIKEAPAIGLNVKKEKSNTLAILEEIPQKPSSGISSKVQAYELPTTTLTDTNSISDPIAIRSSRSNSREYYIDGIKTKETFAEEAGVADFEERESLILPPPSSIDSVSILSGIPQRTITGQVIEKASGEALPFASVFVPGKPIGTTTDFEGNFSITIDSSVEQLQIAYTGFQDAIISIEEKNNIHIALDGQSQNLLENVVVSDYASPKALSKRKKESSKVVGPKKGFKKFRKYIRENLLYPDAAKSNKIEGDVIVEFLILPSGQLTDFAILKSLGYGCDEEAIRLLKEGPKWQVSPNYTFKKAKYTIPFRLKK